jgi:hypothetical protein
MRSADWVALLRLIPAELQDNLCIVFTNGMELAVQSILRLEEPYLVIRGRPAGTTDSGRVFFVPYNQITFVGFQKPMQEADVRALYGDTPAAEAPSTETPTAADADTDNPATQPAADTAAPTAAPPAAPATARPAGRPSALGKHSILERLRARAQASNPPKPPGGGRVE